MTKANYQKVMKIKEQLQEIFEKETDSLESKSEKFLESEKGEEAQNALSDLEDSISSLDNIQEPE